MVDHLNNPDRRTGAGSDAADPAGGKVPCRLLTVPNLLCVIRLVGSVVLAVLACQHRGEAVLWLFLTLAMTDWLDGKLAILLDQRSVIGPLLDSWADAAMYAAALFAALWMHGETLRAEFGWIAAALGTSAASITVALWKYKRWPSYHTRAAKTTWLLVTVAAVCLFAGWATWPVRVALAAAILTNLEELSITILSPTWRADVVSVCHAWRDQRTER